MNIKICFILCVVWLALFNNSAMSDSFNSINASPFSMGSLTTVSDKGLGIHNGDEVPSFSDVPYIAYLEYKRLGIVTSICGAVFISNEYLLTATHCLRGNFPLHKEGFTVYYDGANKKNINTWKSVKILSWKTCPGYMSPVMYANDVALIKLASKVDSSVVPIKIMTPEDENKYLNYGVTYVDAYGWGLTKSGNIPDNLMHMNALLGSREQIREMVSQETNRKYSPEFMLGTISANGQVIDKGDSGGPLVANCDGKTCLIGIASWVSNNGVISFFTRLTNRNIQKWIITTMQKWD